MPDTFLTIEDAIDVVKKLADAGRPVSMGDFTRLQEQVHRLSRSDAGVGEMMVGRDTVG